MILYRPVGMSELILIYQSRMRKFPPRLPEQPFFYPVLNFRYAEQISKEWNIKRSPFIGYVTRFEVNEDYAAKFERHVVGESWHEELWVSAGALEQFNEHIHPPIQVVSAYFGDKFRGHIPNKCGMKDRSVVEQFILLEQQHQSSTQDFHGEIAANHLTVFLNYLFWAGRDFSQHNISPARREQILSAIHSVWAEAFPEIPLPSFTLNPDIIPAALPVT
jgi:hypothetical protein